MQQELKKCIVTVILKIYASYDVYFVSICPILSSLYLISVLLGCSTSLLINGIGY